MRRRAYIGIGAAVLILSLSVSSIAPGAPSRFTPKPHIPDGYAATPGGTPDPPPDAPSEPSPVPPGCLAVMVDTGSRIRATLVAANRIEILANVPWRLIATADGACVLAEGGPTGATAAYITLPEDAVAYWVTPR